MSRLYAAIGAPWWRGAMWVSAAVLLVTPLVAMQFTEQVAWTGFDFAVAALLLSAVCGSIEISTRTSSAAGAAGTAIAMFGVLAIIWVNLAVGIVGSEGEPVNLLFFAVVAFGLSAAALAHAGLFSLSNALIATAALQVTAAVVAFAFTRDLSAIFAAALSLPFLVSARLIASAESSS